MKKVTFTLIIGLFAVGLTYSQTMVDFEDPATYVLTGANMTVATVANPDASGDNASDSVGMAVRDSASLWNQSIVIDLVPNITITEGNNRLELQMYCTTAEAALARAYMRFRDGTGVTYETWSSNVITDANSWTTMLVEGIPDGTEIDSLSFEIGSWDGDEDAAMQGDTIYFDNFVAVAPPAVYVDPRIVTNAVHTTVDIVIDGAPIEADWISAEDNALLNGDSLTGFAGSFKALWDADYLYLLFTIVDATVYEYDGADAWQKDGVQTYLDVRNQLLEGRIESMRQHQLSMCYGMASDELQGWNGTIIDSIYANEEHSEYVEIASLANGDGYYLEARIPFASMYFDGEDVNSFEAGLAAAADLSADDVIGFEAQANDYDESAGDRVAVITWSSTSGDDPGAYQNSGVWGGLKLVSGEVAVKDIANSDISIYPNPVQSELTIGGENIASVSIISILGKEVLTVENNNVINVSDLQNGLYILKVTTDNNEVFSTQFVKK